MIGWRPRLRLYWPKIRGDNNRIVLGQRSRLVGYVEMRGRNNTILFGDDVRFSGKIYVKGQGQTLRIGAGSSLRGSYIVLQENCDITIGEGCLVSRGVEIRTSDAHSLLDAKSGRRINPAASVVIGDHVWIGAKAFISKGSEIGANSVVGAMSFVSAAFTETGVVIAGVPGKIIQRGVNWHVERRKRFKLED